MAHAWKACWVHALAGSNPASSAAGPARTPGRPTRGEPGVVVQPAAGPGPRCCADDEQRRKAGSTLTTVQLMTTTVTTRSVEYAADGLTMVGHLAIPAGVDRRPAVLLGPDGIGLDDVDRRRADALAELGYVALAFDIHGGRQLLDPEEMLARCMPLL